MRLPINGLVLLGLLLIIATLSTVPAFGQTAPAPTPPPTLQDLGFSTFSMTASAMSLKGSKQPAVMATDLNQTLAVTPTFSLRADEIIAPSTNLSSYLGGFKLFLPASKILSKTTLSPLQLYLTAGAGVNRLTDSAGNPVQHIAFAVGGGANWNPIVTGNLSVNLFEARYARFPGYANNVLLFSSGLKLSF